MIVYFLNMQTNYVIVNRRLFFTALALFLAVVLNAQPGSLIVNDNLRLPKDSLEQVQLLNSLDNFLELTYTDRENPFVLASERAETQILLNEIKGTMAKDKSSNIKPYLMNIEPLSNKQSYLIQVAYMNGSNGQPMLLACFDFIAHKTDNGFLFSSPLLRNTKDWKTKKQEYLVMHYQSDANERLVDQYMAYLLDYDRKLGLNKQTEYYFCDECESMVQAMQLTGIRYKVDYNGYSWNSIDFDTDEKVIAIETQRISRQQTIDPHDLFHFRASIAIPEDLNHYMVCGCAYVYGGSWRISWTDIKKMFKSRMAYDEHTDWLQLYFDRYNFGESQEKHLLVTQFINALIVERIEKEQGFSAVMKLLASGNMYKERDKFFTTLEKVTGINEKNFNKKVKNLILDL